MNKIVKLLFLGLSGKIRLVVGICFLITLLVLGIFIYTNLEANRMSVYQANLMNITRLIYQMTDLYLESSIECYLTGIAQKTLSMAGYFQAQAARGEITEDKARALLKALILDPGYGKIGETGYIATLDSNGMATIHPKAGVEGTLLAHIPVMQKAIQLKNGYIRYLWKNPEDPLPEEKAAAIAYFKPWDMIIWVTSYKLDASLLIDLDKLHDNVTKLKIGEQGYCYIMDTKGKLLIHPDSKLEGKVIYENRDAVDRPYIAEICKAVLAQAALSDAENRKTGLTVQPDTDIQGSVIDDTADNSIEPQTVFYPGETALEKNPRKRIAAYAYYKDMDWIIVSSASVAEMYENIEAVTQTIIWIVIAAFLISNAILAFFIYLVVKPIAQMKSIGALVSGGNLNMRLEITTNDEIGEIADQFNGLLDNFQHVLNRIQESSSELLASVQGLATSSQQIAATSNEQAAAVKEIVSTMEDSDSLARSIAERIDGVTQITDRMKETVAGGFSIIKGSLVKMDEIKHSNADTILGVQALSSKIGSIWEIVNIINSIADQTKIIAFNAELEASAAGEAGRNFQIVATEIRRLADNTVASTNEIKAHINEIQHSADSLILSSEEGTLRIKEGWNLSNDLQQVFAAILYSSESAAGSAGQIALSINQQVAAFDQILLTLKQISEGIDDFVDSTRTTTRESGKLKELADNLNAAVNQYTGRDPGR